MDELPKELQEKPVEAVKSAEVVRGVPFKKGEDPRRNTAGKPTGTRDFYTDFKEAVKQLKDKTTGEPLDETKIILIGLQKMIKGDARFEGLYKDLMDRVYGKPKQQTDITSGGEKLMVMPIELINKNDDEQGPTPA